MWTLHVEFWGSMLVLMLVALRRRLTGLWYGASLVAVLWLLGPSHYTLFLLGFVFYQVRNTLLGHLSAGMSAMGMALVLCGLYVCTVKDVALVDTLLALANRVSYLNAYSFHWQSEFGAVLVFGGLMLLATLRNLLCALPVQWLGRVSFSVYLLHFPVMLTLGCTAFAVLAQSGYALACVAATALGAGATYLAAAWFERHVDAPSTRWSHHVTRGIDNFSH